MFDSAADSFSFLKFQPFLLLLGTSVGMIDFNIWPHIERFYNIQMDGTIPVLQDYQTRWVSYMSIYAFL